MGFSEPPVGLDVVTTCARVPVELVPGGPSVPEAQIVIVDVALQLFSVLTAPWTPTPKFIAIMISIVRKYFTAGARVVVLSCDVSALVTGAKQEEQRARSAASKLLPLTLDEFAKLHEALPEAGRLRRLRETGQDARGTVIDMLYHACADAFARGTLTARRPDNSPCILVLDGGATHQTTVLSDTGDGDGGLCGLVAFIPPVGEADLRIGAFVRYFIRRSADLRAAYPGAVAADKWFGWATMRVISKDSDMRVILALALIAERDVYSPTSHLHWPTGTASTNGTSAGAAGDGDGDGDEFDAIGRYLHHVALASVRPASTFGPIFLTANATTTYDVTRIAERLCFAAGGASPLECVFKFHMIGSDFVSAAWAKQSAGAPAASKRIAGPWLELVRELDNCALSASDFAHLCRGRGGDGVALSRRLIVDRVDASGHWHVGLSSEAMAAFLVRVDTEGGYTRAGKPVARRVVLNVDASLVAASNALFATIMHANGSLPHPTDPTRPNHPFATETDETTRLPLWGWQTTASPTAAAAATATASVAECAGIDAIASASVAPLAPPATAAETTGAACQYHQDGRVERVTTCALSRRRGVFPRNPLE